MGDYTIKVEPDELDAARFKIVVRDPDYLIVTVPARGLTERDAVLRLPSIMYAFEAGTRVASGVIKSFIFDRLPLHLKEVVDEES